LIESIGEGASNVTRWISRFDRFDRRLAALMARYGITLLRLSVGIVYFWFGLLKFFPA
jgi:uncharacterized membrane protein YkgB